MDAGSGGAGTHHRPALAGGTALGHGLAERRRGSPCPAYYARISDSGAGSAFLVYGGDWGLRFKRSSESDKWDMESPDQWGEPWLVLAEESDIVAEDTGSVHT